MNEAFAESFALTSPEAPEARRNYRTEVRNSRTELATKMVMLREARLGPSPEVIVTAQFLIFMGLPNRPTSERVIRKSTRMGDGSQIVVTFTAMNEGIDLPYGSDVNMLHWMINRAVQLESPFVSWETAQEYLTWMNLSKGGRTLRRSCGRASSGSPGWPSPCSGPTRPTSRPSSCRSCGPPGCRGA